MLTTPFLIKGARKGPSTASALFSPRRGRSASDPGFSSGKSRSLLRLPTAGPTASTFPLLHVLPWELLWNLPEAGTPQHHPGPFPNRTHIPYHFPFPSAPQASLSANRCQLKTQNRCDIIIRNIFDLCSSSWHSQENAFNLSGDRGDGNPFVILFSLSS